MKLLLKLIMEEDEMSLLYHYANNHKGFGILDDKAIRLSDIRKSNDYEELILFYPDIFDEILKLYNSSQFKFQYNNQNDEEAMRSILHESYIYISESIENGDFSNFVFCFSEKEDMLSEWRGYADDGQGISIGFSKEVLEDKCNKKSSIFRLERVNYITDEKRKEIINKMARKVIKEFKGLRKWIVSNITLDDLSPDTDVLLFLNLNSMIRSIMIDSLKYKKIGFKEEKEWRLFLSNQAYKNPEWVTGKDCYYRGSNGFSETLSFLRNKIEFNITDNNISPYVRLLFSEIGDSVIKEIWLGPKNCIAIKDLELYLSQHQYNDIKICRSETSYC